MAMALHVLMGKNKGQEYLLPEEGDFLLGRSDDNVLIDDTTALCKHAVLKVKGDRVVVKDLDSGEPTYVNRKKVHEAILKEGDRIRIGKTQLMLVAVTRFSAVAGEAKARASAAAAEEETPAPPPPSGEIPAEVLPASQVAAPESTAATEFPAPPAEPGALAGSLSDVSLVDLLGFILNSGKSGILNLNTEGDFGAICISNGQIVTASISNNPAPNAKRALYRLVRWQSGTFAFNPSPVQIQPAIAEPIEVLMLEAIHERESLATLASQLPPLDAKLGVAKLLPPELNKLAPAEMYVLGLVRLHGKVRTIVDNHPENDLSALMILADLMQRKVIFIA